MRKSIVLIGPMGSAKTTVGKIIAQTLDLDFFDCDNYFTERFGRIDKFFADFGESEFRNKESEILLYAASLSDTVISTGGGAVLSEQGMKALKQNSVIIYMYARPEILQKRIEKSGRPLAQKAEELFLKRKPLYEKYCDYNLDNSDLTKEQCVQSLLNTIKISNF